MPNKEFYGDLVEIVTTLQNYSLTLTDFKKLLNKLQKKEPTNRATIHNILRTIWTSYGSFFNSN